MRTAVLTLALALVAAPAARAQGLAPDLALVPANAYGFVHLRAAEIAQHESLKSFRNVFAKAGPKALAAFEARFVPNPRTVERVTLALVPGRNGEPAPYAVIRFSEKFDVQAVTKAYAIDPTPLAAGALKAYRADQDSLFAVPNDQTIIVAPAGAWVDAVKGAPAAPKAAAALAAQLAAAQASKAVVYAALDRQALPIPDEALRDVPAAYQPLTKAQRLIVTVDLAAKQATAVVRAEFKDEDDATAAQDALTALAKVGRAQINAQRAELEAKFLNAKPPAPGDQSVFDSLGQSLGELAGLGAMNQADELLAKPPLVRDGKALTASVTASSDGLAGPVAVPIAVGLLLPAVQKVREAAARSQSSNNLKQIALAMFNYESANGHFPPAAICDKDGKPLLSWRVAILPYLEQDALYKKFKLDEPWDSPNNKPLSEIMVKVYTDPRVPAPGAMTYYKVFTGNGAAFDIKSPRKIVSITDGTSNTIMAVAAGAAVPWSKPEDIPFDPKAKIDLAAPFGNVLAAMCDGSVRLIQVPAGEAGQNLLKALIGADDGQVVTPPQ